MNASSLIGHLRLKLSEISEQDTNEDEMHKKPNYQTILFKRNYELEKNRYLRLYCQLLSAITKAFKKGTLRRLD